MLGGLDWAAIASSDRHPHEIAVVQSATPEETAAIGAAIERFVAETTDPRSPRPQAAPGRWALTARREAVGIPADQPRRWDRARTD